MINFMKYKMLYLAISSVIIVAGLLAMGIWGFRYSIDFIGGTNLEYRINKDFTTDKVREVFKKQQIEVAEARKEGSTLFVKTKPIDDKKELAIRTELKKTFNTSITVLRTETVGPVLGRETMIKTVLASVIAILGILLYMTFAFKGWDFAVAAVLAMMHDFLVVIGTYAIMSHFWGAEVDTMFVTALLTAMSFSVHDTIVIFDKIREYVKSQGEGSIELLANKALTETLVRSFNNSMTIIFMLLSLTILGGTTIRFFVATLLVGTITGTYSSPFVATPILVWLKNRKQ